MSRDLTGQVIEGRYRLDALLGEGAIGSVYEGRQLAVDRRVAIKLLHPFLRDSGSFRLRFEIEAKALARLSHPHILTVHDFGYDERLSLNYMVVEFVDGYELASVQRPVGFDFAMTIAYQVAEALEAAHGRNILHRDLKPENIMIDATTPRPMVKVLDFGLAQLFEEEGEDLTDTMRRRRLTQAGEIYGTPTYMSPEQCNGSRDLGFESDLYSLGVILYEMLEGRPPFEGPSPPVVMLKHVNDPVPPIQADIPDEIVRLLEWMLNKVPEQRPRSASQVIDILRPHVLLDVSQELRMPAGDRVASLELMSDSSGSWSRDQVMPTPAQIEASEVEARLENTATNSQKESGGSGKGVGAMILVGTLCFVAGIGVGGALYATFGTTAPTAPDIQPVVAPEPVTEAPQAPVEEAAEVIAPEPDEGGEAAEAGEKYGVQRAIGVAAAAMIASQRWHESSQVQPTPRKGKKRKRTKKRR